MNRTGAALRCNTTKSLPTQRFFDGDVRHEAMLHLFFGTMSHFFGDFKSWFSRVPDPRQRNKTTYPLESLVFIGILMYVGHLGARRQVRLMLPTAESRQTFRTLFHVDGLPHGDTLNDAFKMLDPDRMQDVVCSPVKGLIRKKVLYPYRVLDKYFVVAIDGTGTVTYSARHCPHCLTQTRNGKTTYYHKVLEAKLVTPDGFAFSLMSEFIENPGVNPKKQDCELKAFYRLAPRLKAAFPHLPILLSLDALYAGGPVFQICDDFNWKYMIVLTDDDLRSVNEEFHALAALEASNRLSWRTGPKAEINQDFRWVEDILYTDSEKREHTLQAIECVETKPDRRGEVARGTWRWITNMRVSRSTVVALANEGGRNRWKIENQGFKAQKRGGYELEHAYTADPNSAKIFYFILQIAHIVAQLMFKGSLLGRAGRKALGSARNLAKLLLEAWRNRSMGPDEMQAITTRRMQIRFCPDTS